MPGGLPGGGMGGFGIDRYINSRLFIMIFGISTAKSKFSLAAARITNLLLITMIASQAKYKQNRVCLIEIY